MSKQLTGETRYRLQPRLFRRPLLVLEVEFIHTVSVRQPLGFQDRQYTYWLDATPADLQELASRADMATPSDAGGLVGRSSGPVELTGRTRHRLVTRHFRPPLLALEVEEVGQLSTHLSPGGTADAHSLQWRDATMEDLHELAELEQSEPQQLAAA